MARDVIDVHTHCFAGLQDSARVREGLGAARAAGLARMVVVGLVNLHLDAERMWDLVPRYVDHRGDPLFNEAEDLLALSRETHPTLVPFVDFRHLWGDVAGRLSGYLAAGFRGLKGLYLADGGNDIGVKGVPEAFGVSVERYREREWEIFAFAAEHDLPVVYHIDVKRYADVAAAILADFPKVRFDFAHFGIGRKALRSLLERHANLYTDLASMLPHMRKDPESYREFILDHPDRVCFGSDSFLYGTETAVEYIRLVEELSLPAEVEEMVLSANPRRFLGRALDG